MQSIKNPTLTIEDNVFSDTKSIQHNMSKFSLELPKQVLMQIGQKFDEVKENLTRKVKAFTGPDKISKSIVVATCNEKTTTIIKILIK